VSSPQCVGAESARPSSGPVPVIVRPTAFAATVLEVPAAGAGQEPPPLGRRVAGG
jgi:hypothetical protein